MILSGPLLVGFLGLIISMVGISKSQHDVDVAVNYIIMSIASTIFIVLVLIFNVIKTLI
jgi:hypothetical protein